MQRRHRRQVYNLTRLIGAERVSRRDFKYEGTYYVTEDGETFEKKYVETQKSEICKGYADLIIKKEKLIQQA